MNKFISKEVYKALFNRAGVLFPENHSYKTDILNNVEYPAIWKRYYELLKRGVKFQYLIKNRLSETMQHHYIINDFKSPFSMYNYFFIMSDNSVMCPECFEKEINLVNGEFYNVNFVCENMENNFEDNSLYCDFCNEIISEAYPAE